MGAKDFFFPSFLLLLLLLLTPGISCERFSWFGPNFLSVSWQSEVFFFKPNNHSDFEANKNIVVLCIQLDGNILVTSTPLLPDHLFAVVAATG